MEFGFLDGCFVDGFVGISISNFGVIAQKEIRLHVLREILWDISLESESLIGINLVHPGVVPIHDLVILHFTRLRWIH